MMTFLRFLQLQAFLLLVFLLSNCRSHGPAFSANANPYLAKPVYRGVDVSVFYLSGRYNQGYIYYPEEKNRSMELEGHVSYMYENFYFCGGFYGYWGKYRVNTSASPVAGGSDQRFYGGGPRVEIGARAPLGELADLLIGGSGEVFIEGGEFSKNSSNAYSDLFSLGLNRVNLSAAPALDLRFTPLENWDIGLRYSADTYISISNLLDDKPNNSLLQRLTLHASTGRLTAFGQMRFTRDHQRVYSLGMAFGFPIKKDGTAEK